MCSPAASSGLAMGSMRLALPVHPWSTTAAGWCGDEPGAAAVHVVRRSSRPPPAVHLRRRVAGGNAEEAR